MIGSRPASLYMTIGGLFGLLKGGILWFDLLFRHSLPTEADAIVKLGFDLLFAALLGLLRAFDWLPSLIYYVALHHMEFETWALGSGW